MLSNSRVAAATLGLIVLGWQGWNAWRGDFYHRFLVADLLLGSALIVAASWRPDRASAVMMLAAFSAMGGVFLAATTGALLRGGYDLGAAATTVGLIPCLAHGVVLGRRLAGWAIGPAEAGGRPVEDETPHPDHMPPA
jgi:hypothetical protein